MYDVLAAIFVYSFAVIYVVIFVALAQHAGRRMIHARKKKPRVLPAPSRVD